MARQYRVAIALKVIEPSLTIAGAEKVPFSTTIPIGEVPASDFVSYTSGINAAIGSLDVNNPAAARAQLQSARGVIQGSPISQLIGISEAAIKTACDTAAAAYTQQVLDRRAAPPLPVTDDQAMDQICENLTTAQAAILKAKLIARWGV